MAIEVITDFKNIDTVRIIAYIYDDDGDLVDPTSVAVTVYDPDDIKQVNGQAMTKSATGIYEYYYHTDATADPMDAGQWRGYIKVIDGTGASAVISTDNFSFKVE